MPNVVVQPYLFFGGRCQEAIDFYRSALGAEVKMLMLFRDSPEAAARETLPPGFEDKVMHSELQIGATSLMASDGCQEGTNFGGFALSISVPAEADADRMFAALVEGGSVQMALQKTFWSPRFGVLTDRFGVSWMINTEDEAAR